MIQSTPSLLKINTSWWRNLLELLKNSLVPINKTASIARFHKIETDGELIFQQFYFIKPGFSVKIKCGGTTTISMFCN
ncbi:hypothetical protein LIMHP_03645 [Leptospira interrogans serovar Manilae]|nr:hypothetical protein LIMLP_03660 [Leptospira interrogans serovar Manilae]AKP28918.1 hypothetical protein LIMHP_03645 [Leptospira interrogans serovar Manilae]EYU63876.1 hypothetical protein CI00_11430 [Leptospira interrogans serovar Manilae]